MDANRKECGIAADLRKILSDNDGNLSSKRILSVSWGMSVLGTWIYCSVTASPPALATIPPEVAAAVVTLAGVTAAGKVAEKEKPPGDRPAPPPPPHGP